MEFNVGDFVWAKMKGFPPWPATVSYLILFHRDCSGCEPTEHIADTKLFKVISSSVENSDIPSGKYGILFYGTHDTAFMKPSELSDYMTHREAYEVPRKFKGFAEGIQEIRVAAGIKTSVKTEPETSEPIASSSSANPNDDSLLNRTRKKSTRTSTADEFAHPDSIHPRFRSLSRSGRMPRLSTSGNVSDNKLATDSDSKKVRSRASSISTRRSKKLSYSDKMDYVDLSDIDSVLQNGVWTTHRVCG